MRIGKIGLWAVAAVLLAGSAARAEMTDNPEYKMWAKYKAGTMVKMKSVTSGPATAEMVITTTLKSIDDQKAMVEMKTSMQAAGQSFDMPAQNRDVPAKIASDGTAVPKGDKEAPKADVTTGEETLKIAGKDVKCKWTQTIMKKDGSTITSKVWQSDEIPGGTAKMDAKTEGDVASNTTMTVVDYAVK